MRNENMNGDINEDWAECELKDVLKLTKAKHKPLKEEDHFYVGLEHIEKGTGRLTESATSTSINTVKNIFEPGQILYGKLRPYFNKVHFSKQKGVCSTDILVFQPMHCALPKFTLHYMQSRSFVNHMSSNMSGVNLPRVSTKIVESYKFPLPPLPIQRAIVSKIESLFSSLDSGIADLKKAQAQLKIYRQAVLKKAFEGELTKEWREEQTDLPSADELLELIKNERKKHYDKQMAEWEVAVGEWEKNGKDGKKPSKSKVTVNKTTLDFAKNQSSNISIHGWGWLNLIHICKEKCLGKMLDKNKNQGFFKPYLGNINVRWGRFDLENAKQMKFLESENEKYNLVKGDLVICEGGEPGRCAVWCYDQEMKIQKALHRVRFFGKCHDSKFIYFYIFYCASVGILSKYFTGTTIKHLTGQGLSKLLIPVQSLKEQTQIVKEIESRLSVCDNVEDSVSLSLKKAEALRQSILKKAFEGKLLTPTEIKKCKKEKDYEPASVLLERIKAEKNN